MIPRHGFQVVVFQTDMETSASLVIVLGYIFSVLARIFLTTRQDS